jgi:signal peptidase I
MVLSSVIAQAEEPSNTLQLIDKIARTPVSTVVLFLAACTMLRWVCYAHMKNTPPQARFGLYTVSKLFNEILDAIVYAGVLVFLVIRPYFVQTFHVPSGSMLDTLQLGDFLIANKFVYRFNEPQVGDIVIFRAPKIGLLNPKVTEMDYIKRLVGKEGDVVEIKEGHLYRNGQKVNEPYLKEPYILYDFKLVKYDNKYIPLQYKEDRVNFYVPLTSPTFLVEDPRMMALLKSLPPAKIPKDHFLMMGDNRNGSYDGRAWGLISRDSIIAKAEFIWFPLNRIGQLQ